MQHRLRQEVILYDRVVRLDWEDALLLIAVYLEFAAGPARSCCFSSAGPTEVVHFDSPSRSKQSNLRGAQIIVGLCSSVHDRTKRDMTPDQSCSRLEFAADCGIVLARV